MTILDNFGEKEPLDIKKEVPQGSIRGLPNSEEERRKKSSFKTLKRGLSFTRRRLVKKSWRRSTKFYNNGTFLK